MFGKEHGQFEPVEGLLPGNRPSGGCLNEVDDILDAVAVGMDMHMLDRKTVE